MMSERVYEGDPIDGGWSSYFDADDHGETVAGSTSEADGRERVDLWPSALPRDQFSDAQADAIRACVIHPELSSEQIAKRDGFDYSGRTVRLALKKAALFATDEDIPRISLPEVDTSQTTVQRMIEYADDELLLPAYRDAGGRSWPDGVEASRDELTADAERVILKAATDDAFASVADLGRAVEYEEEHNDNYANQVLSRHWPKKYEELKKQTPNNQHALAENDVSDIRKRLLNGESSRDVSEDYPVGRDAITAYARGARSVDPDEPPALEYDSREQEYHVVEGSEPTEEDEDTTDSGEAEDRREAVAGTAPQETPAWVVDVVVFLIALRRVVDRVKQAYDQEAQ